MKTTQKTLLIIILIFAVASCAKDEVTPSSDNPSGTNPVVENPSTAATDIVLENSTFTGTCIINYSDASTASGTFTNGKMSIPNSGTGRIIASIQPQNQQIILIGRKEGAVLTLNYINNTLSYRSPINGSIPIDTVSEFKLINLSAITLSASFRQEADLYFLNTVWQPIGTVNAPFNGTFDGASFEIHGLNVNLTGAFTQYAGLFGYATSNSLLRKITVKSGIVKCPYRSAGIVAEGGNISSCKNYAKIEGYEAAGIAVIVNTTATNNFISNCDNYGDIIGTKICSGIFQKDTNSTIANCINNGKLTGSEVYGIIQSAKSITSCTNNGQIIGTNNYSGAITCGIVGTVTDLISACTNNGDISGYEVVYGIAGSVTGFVTALTVLNCTNNGNIIATGGNIVAGISTGGQNNKNCKNTGNINVTSAGSAFVCGIAFTGNFENCHNTGNINANINSTSNGNTFCGGINTNAMNYIDNYSYVNCSNSGNINSNGSSGGIIGWSPYNDSVKNCFNSGNINGAVAGGIIGYRPPNGNGTYSSSAINCYNSGTITSPNTDTAGGIIGFCFSGGASNCFNIGNSTGGAILGLATITSVINCYWKQGSANYAIAGVEAVGGGTIGSNAGATLFSATAWPSAANGWTTINWKTLGSWNNGSPTYPKLIWEN